MVPLLTDPLAHGADPADAFDVVVPDMPGFRYSDRPTGPPLDSIAVAGLWAELMDVLGYARFGAAGGDIGSAVSRFLAHSTSPTGSWPSTAPTRDCPSSPVIWPLGGARGRHLVAAAQDLAIGARAEAAQVAGARPQRPCLAVARRRPPA